MICRSIWASSRSASALLQLPVLGAPLVAPDGRRQRGAHLGQARLAPRLFDERVQAGRHLRPTELHERGRRPERAGGPGDELGDHGHHRADDGAIGRSALALHRVPGQVDGLLLALVPAVLDELLVVGLAALDDVTRLLEAGLGRSGLLDLLVADPEHVVEHRLLVGDPQQGECLRVPLLERREQRGPQATDLVAGGSGLVDHGREAVRGPRRGRVGEDVADGEPGGGRLDEEPGVDRGLEQGAAGVGRRRCPSSGGS